MTTETLPDPQRETELQRENRELRRQTSELQASNRVKDDFIAMLAHELRNPLAPILQSVALLGEGASKSDVQQAGAIIQRQVRHMSRLLDDLLDVSRVTLGKMTLRTACLDLIAVLRSALTTCELPIGEKEHDLTLELPKGPIWVEGDSTRLEQIFCNLLTNAARYTPRGGKINIHASQQGGNATVRIRDSGIGIAPEMPARIFEPFAQAEPSPDNPRGGLGIGLTLVQSLVRLHGGAVHAISEGLGKGSEFVVILPVAGHPTQQENPVADRQQIEPAPERAKPLRVLLVEDNRDSAETLAKLIKRWGHEIEVFGQGEPALLSAASRPFHVAILDIGLPDLDGNELAQALRVKCGPGLRLVATSGYGMEEDRKKTRQAGFDYHFVKPVDPADIRKFLTDVSIRISSNETGSIIAAPLPPALGGRRED